MSRNSSPVAAKPGSSGKTEKSPFQKLWEKAGRLKKNNLDFERALDDLVKRLDTEIHATEMQFFAAQKEMALRLLDFSKRKSLALWQREEIDQWLDSLVSSLSKAGMLDDELSNAIAVKHAREMNIQLDQHSELSAAEQLDQFYEMHDDQAEDTAFNFEEILEELFRQSGDDAQHSNDYEDYANQEYTQKQGPSMHDDFAGKPATARFDSQLFKRLFRQVANAVHPDKETDPLLRENRHQLMSELLTARKANDLLTIIRLHQEHVGSELDFTKTDEQELMRVLQRYLDEQQEEKLRIANKSVSHALAYEHFYHKSKKQMNLKISRHLESIRQQTDSHLHFLNTVKSLVKLKPILEARYDAHHWRRFD